MLPHFTRAWGILKPHQRLAARSQGAQGHTTALQRGVFRRRQRHSKPTAHLNKLHSELAVEGGDLSLHAQLAPADGEGDYFVVGCTVTHALKDIQIFHHNVAVEAHVKHL